MTRTQATHPFAVEVHQRSSEGHGDQVIGLQLFATREEAEKYAEENEEDHDWDGWCSVRRASKGETEFC